MGRPRLIILIRHGESESNCDKSVNRYVPNHKVPLTARGHEQARAAGRHLCDVVEPGENVLIYTSPYRRTRETTEEITTQLQSGGIDYRVYEEPRLREQDFGNFQFDEVEMTRIWKERARYGHFFYRIPNGESAADVYDRCAGFNETLFRQFSSDKFAKVLVLVTHGLMTRVFLMKWYRWTVERFESLRNVHYCEFVTMERQESSKYLLKNKMRTWSDPPFDELTGATTADDPAESDAISNISPLVEKQNQIRAMYEEMQKDAAANEPPMLHHIDVVEHAAEVSASEDSDDVFDDGNEAAENGICINGRCRPRSIMSSSSIDD
ncbi:histidine phosphatase superfamily [Limtongia smithiae]|uniref:histidine phosphatase superfamily n=1 Tax=Limtongia smithiae TaxID=1125753 RepID=UPI0034CE6596